MTGEENTVVRIHDGHIEWRVNGHELRMDAPSTLQLALKALEVLSWTPISQMGLRQEHAVVIFESERLRRAEMQRLDANGLDVEVEQVERVLIAGPWIPTSSADPRLPVLLATPSDEQIPVQSTKAATRKAKKAQRTPAGGGGALIETRLFADPQEQLRYEVRHTYLMTVPLSQQEQWPLGEYTTLPIFLTDVATQSGKQVSRQQIINAIVDVVSSRVHDVGSRRVHPMRVTTTSVAGSHHPIRTRSFDGATGWRASVSFGTPQARRIMWWRTRSGRIDLVRLAAHDDMAMPER